LTTVGTVLSGNARGPGRPCPIAPGRRRSRQLGARAGPVAGPCRR
jgi:hypothetical protein